jgi:hypothetical protein
MEPGACHIRLPDGFNFGHPIVRTKDIELLEKLIQIRRKLLWFVVGTDLVEVSNVTEHDRNRPGVLSNVARSLNDAILDELRKKATKRLVRPLDLDLGILQQHVFLPPRLVMPEAHDSADDGDPDKKDRIADDDDRQLTGVAFFLVAVDRKLYDEYDYADKIDEGDLDDVDVEEDVGAKGDKAVANCPDNTKAGLNSKLVQQHHPNCKRSNLLVVLHQMISIEVSNHGPKNRDSDQSH